MTNGLGLGYISNPSGPSALRDMTVSLRLGVVEDLAHSTSSTVSDTLRSGAAGTLIRFNTKLLAIFEELSGS
jgi:hypothetical protein